MFIVIHSIRVYPSCINIQNLYNKEARNQPRENKWNGMSFDIGCYDARSRIFLSGFFFTLLIIMQFILFSLNEYNQNHKNCHRSC